jgi:cytochrome c-type biogenesis protein
MAAEHISYLVALMAGVLSFLSPCVLPLVPGYIAFLSGRSLEELLSGSAVRAIFRATLTRAGIFCLGFTTIFTLMGASASAIGHALSSSLGLWTKVAGAIIVVFGVHMTGVVQIPWLNYQKSFDTRRIAPGMIGAALMGAAFAFGWTPCIGPILAGILTMAATQETVYHGMSLLFVYSLGLGIPFMLTALGIGTFVKFFAAYKRYLRWGEIVSGVLLVILGSLVFTNRLTILLQWVPSVFYQFVQ